MNKRLWAALLTAAVTMTSTAVVPYNQVENVIAATTKKPTTAEVVDTSTDGRVTALGYTFRINGSEAIITGYNGTATALSVQSALQAVIKTKIKIKRIR